MSVLAIVALAAAWLVAGPSVQPAAAAAFTVSNEAQLRAAFIAADANGVDDVITLGASFTWSGGFPAEHVDDGHSLEIDGAGFTITGGSGTIGLIVDYRGDDTGSFSLHDITFDGVTSDQDIADVFDAVNVVLDNVHVTNGTFEYAAMYLAGDAVEITDSTFIGNDDTTDNGGAAWIVSDATAQVTGSVFRDNSASGNGGALYVDGNVDIVDSTFEGNFTTDPGTDGGAIFATGLVTVDGGSFTGNSAPDQGGAIYAGYAIVADGASFTENYSDAGQGGALWSSTFVAIGEDEGATFTDNYAAGDGGAVWSGSITDIYDSTFTGNYSVSGEGGAVYSDDDVRVEHSTFDYNTATNSGQSGGAIFAFEDLTVFASEFTNNESVYGGAVYGYGPTTIDESTFDDNYAATHGGAVFSDTSSVSVTNSTFSENHAGDTGGAVWAAGSVSTTYSTFVENNSVAEGGAVTSPGGDLVTEGSVFYTYTASAVILCNLGGTVTSNGYNYTNDLGCLGTATTGDTVSATAPGLAALADNGGPTRTAQPVASSPLIDGGPAGSCIVGSDQRGVDREQGAGCDIGAVEVLVDVEFDIYDDSANLVAQVTIPNAYDYDCVDWTPIAGYAATPPADVVFPLGVLDFCFEVPQIPGGWTTTVVIDLASPVTEAWKVTNGTWGLIPGAVLSNGGTTLTYSLTDGGDLDEDSSVDGWIVDPVGPGIGLSLTG